jgi:hypothetical protein
MTLFGTALDATQIAALVGLLATLAIWVFALRDADGYRRWFRGWSSDKKAETRERDEPPSRTPTGPWG